MGKRLDVVGIGSMVVDVIYRTPRIIGVEEKIPLDRHEGGEIARRFVGGVTLNHLGWARILGLEVGIFGKQADDENGRLLRAGMDRFGIDKHLTLDGSSSSFALVFIDGEGGRCIYMSPGATSETTADYIRREHADYILSARMVSTEISQLPLDAVVAVLQIARDGGAETILDVDVPPAQAVQTLGSREDLERALRLATYLKPSKAAAMELSAERDLLKAAERIRSRYGAKAVVITDGANGCSISTEEGSCAFPALKVKVVDSTGAGDAFLGGMIAGLHYGLDWEDIAKLANACGAACCEIVGAFPLGEESRERVLALYQGRPFDARRFSIARTGQHRQYEEAVQRFLDSIPCELKGLRQKIVPGYFDKAVDLISECESLGGRLHVTGVGKPEHVARYVASLLSGTGTPTYFLHGTEAVHGASGQVKSGDVVIAISNSGETEEIRLAVSAVRNVGARVIGVSGNDKSWLARNCDVFLYAGVAQEGDPLGLAPRASIMAEVYVLAALSVALQVKKGVTPEDFYRWHPSGELGRMLARKLEG